MREDDRQAVEVIAAETAQREPLGNCVSKRCGDGRVERTHGDTLPGRERQGRVPVGRCGAAI
jgi:hypothetical protein